MLPIASLSACDELQPLFVAEHHSVHDVNHRQGPPSPVALFDIGQRTASTLRLHGLVTVSPEGMSH